MGVKGRDMLLWLFWGETIMSLACLLGGYVRPGYFFFAGQVILTVILFYWRYLTRKTAARMSSNLGLKAVGLVPLRRGWVGFLIWLSGHRLEGRWIKAYEVHLLPRAKKTSLTLFLEEMAADLEFLKARMPGCLFMWETSAPLPASIREYVRGQAERGMAIWEKGQWFPGPPGAGKDIKKSRCRYGCVIVSEK